MPYEGDIGCFVYAGLACLAIGTISLHGFRVGLMVLGVACLVIALLSVLATAASGK